MNPVLFQKVLAGIGLQRGCTAVELIRSTSVLRTVQPMLILNLAQQRVQSQPGRPGRCSRCGGQTWQKWGGGRQRPLTDARVKVIRTQRYPCSACGKTTTARPPGVGQARRSQPFTAILGVFYALGLSQRRLEAALALLGYSVDHVTSWRDLQRLGQAARCSTA